LENWRACRVGKEKKIIDAVKIIDTCGAKMALVVDSAGILLGTVTDYDVRQAILKGHSLELDVTTIMNVTPKTAGEFQSDNEIFSKMRLTNVQQLPIVNKANELIGLKLRSELDYNVQLKKNSVVIMAGGLGTRLRPLTDDCPKPLLKIGNKPILEIILESFIEAGFTDFYFSVNYKAEMIKEYFNDGSRYNISIKYLEEKKRAGTAGALSLLPKGIEEPIIVMNGDLLTKVNFQQLLDFHYSHDSTATMCVREYDYQIPYGVVKFDQWEIQELQEKPTCTSFVNAGIYVINPKIFYRVEKDEYFDMTDLFTKNIEKKERTLVFPIREYWLDVGRVEDFEKAQEEYK